MQTIKRWSEVLVVGVVWVGVLVTSSAAAQQADTVHLENGGMLRGQVMESLPGQHVKVRLGDGSVRVIPWDEIARVEAAGSASDVPAPPAYAEGPEAGTSTPPTPRQAALQREITDLEQKRASIRTGGSVAMMVVGGGGFLLFFFPGLALLSLGAVCDEATFDDGDCDSAVALGGVFTALGTVGGVLGVVGLINLVNRNAERRELSRKIETRQTELDRISFDLHPTPQGGRLRLAWRF